ncbi:uncharacterized protein LOC144872558 isoform X2 [Branchiostoma floridae x Branchiostoma japonicum]
MDLDTFFTAVQEGDVQTVRRGLEAGVDVNAKRDDWLGEYQTSLHVASQYGQTEVAELLIKNGANLEARGRLDWTPLHVASVTEVAELLIKNGANLEARGWDQSTPLHKAAAGGRTGTCELLIRSGADVTTKDKVQSTPLHKAAAGGHTGTCELLIRSGADVRATDEDEDTPLHKAAARGHTGICELLIRSGTDVMVTNKHQDTPLHDAAYQAHTGTCELLIRSGADVMIQDKDQSTPLHKAAAADALFHTETCELLIRAGADVTATDKEGKTPLDYARDPETRRHLKNLDKQAKQEKSYHELMQQSGGVKINRFKVFIGGKETTGKSTLKQSLTKGLLSALIQRFSRRSVEEPYDPTPGVDIGTFHVPGVGEVSVWDFAGQSEYAVTHSMFMDAENTVFIVLYNIMGDRKTQEKQVRWWLCFIKSCNPNRQPDVILVASHADQVTLTRGQRQAASVVGALKEEFKDHLRIADEVILMDCRQTWTTEMDRLKRLLVRMRDDLLQRQRDMPKLCAKIMECLPKWYKSKASPRCPVMMWPDYMSEVNKLDRLVTEDFLRESTKFLHHLAELLFITPGTSDPILVLKPNWLGTEVFGPIMAPDNFDIHLQRTSKDYVTREELQRVFQDVADVDLVITLLYEFQFCHTYDKHTYIIPGLLTQTMPGKVWKPTAEPKVVYFGKQVQCADSTDMFSSAAFPRVQTRLMRGMKNHPSLWRDGAKCVDRNVEGLLKLSPDGRAVNICVRSVQGDRVQCDKMLQQLVKIVADVVYECSPGTGTVENVLSARALKEHREEFYSYGKEEIKQAWEEGGTIVHRTLAIEEYICDLLCREDEDPLTVSRPALVQVLRHAEPILDQLQAHGTLTAEECDVIKAKETPQDKARKLLDTIGRKGAPASRDFKAVLKQIIPHAAEMVQGHASDLLCSEDEDSLIRNRTKLIRDLTSRYVQERILNHLLQHHHFSEEECGIIRANKTGHNTARELLDIVGRKGQAARQAFKEVLEEVSPDTAEMVE